MKVEEVIARAVVEADRKSPDALVNRWHHEKGWYAILAWKAEGLEFVQPILKSLDAAGYAVVPREKLDAVLEIAHDLAYTNAKFADCKAEIAAIDEIRTMLEAARGR